MVAECSSGGAGAPLWLGVLVWCSSWSPPHRDNGNSGKFQNWSVPGLQRGPVDFAIFFYSKDLATRVQAPTHPVVRHSSEWPITEGAGQEAKGGQSHPIAVVARGVGRRRWRTGPIAACARNVRRGGDPIAIVARTPHPKEPAGLCLQESNFKVIVHVFSPHVGAMVVHEFVRTGRSRTKFELKEFRRDESDQSESLGGWERS